MGKQFNGGGSDSTDVLVLIFGQQGDISVNTVKYGMDLLQSIMHIFQKNRDSNRETIDDEMKGDSHESNIRQRIIRIKRSAFR